MFHFPRTFRVLKILAFAILACAQLGSAAEDSVRFEAVNPEGAPVRLVKAGDLCVSESLRLEFQLTNRSREFLPWVELTAEVYLPTGNLKGFHSFTLNTNLKPGEQRFFLYRTDELDLSPGERVVLSPTFARLGKGNWSPAPKPSQ